MGCVKKGVGLSNGEIISSTSQPVFAHNDFSTSSVAHFRFAHVWDVQTETDQFWSARW